ncbi:diacylglycerol kinase [Sesbania bispinosa]|nr:diacylglycerol kinase [Sesbania bispinosa]
MKKGEKREKRRIWKHTTVEVEAFQAINLIKPHHFGVTVDTKVRKCDRISLNMTHRKLHYPE